MIIACDYLRPLFNEQKTILVNRTVRFLKKQVKGDTCLAFTGMSGALFVPLVAEKTGLPMLVVRKNESNHSYRITEGLHHCKNYIIIDDLISSGRTISNIVEAVNYSSPKSKLNGIILYNNTVSKHFPKSEHYDKPNVDDEDTLAAMQINNCWLKIVGPKLRKLFV